MDQLISALGLEGRNVLIVEAFTYKDAPIPLGMEIMLVNSNVKRSSR